MQPVKWFHRGTAPMVAIYPDDGSGGLRSMHASDGLRPVRWTHNGTGVGMAIYPDDTDGTIRPLPEITRDPGLAPVHWFHEGRYPMTVNFNDEYPPAGGGEEYTTGAVHLDGATWLENEALVAATGNVRHAAYVFWMKNAAIADNPYAPIFAVDPGVAYQPLLAIETDNNGVDPDVNTIYNSFANADSSSSDGVATNEVGPLTPATNAVVPGVWLCVLGNVDTDHPVNERVVKLWVNDENVNTIGSPIGPAYDLLFNGKEIVIGSDYGSSLITDLADFWLAPGQFIDFSIEANRRKFISAEGKPVDLGADGSTPTGTAPAIFFRRDPSAAASTFANNLGTGGAFAITGTLTNADTSPSDA